MPVDPDALARSLRSLHAAAHRDATLVGEPLAARFAQVVSAAGDVLGADSVGVLLLDEHDRVRAVAASGDASATLDRAEQETAVGPGVDTVRTGLPVRVDDLSTAEPYAPLRGYLRDVAIGAVVSVPIRIDERVVGSLTAICAEPRRWTDTELNAAAAFAEVVAVVLSFSARRAAAVASTAAQDGRGPDGG